MKMATTTAFAEALDPCIENWAEQTVQIKKVINMPQVEMRNNVLRPSRSTKKHMPVATTMFVNWRIPLMSS